MDTLKRTSCIKKSEVIDPYAQTIKIDSNLGINSIITSTSDKELKAIIHIEKNKFEMDCEEEIEEHQKECLESLSKINEKKNKEGFNPIMEINNLKWEQRNMIELIFPEKGGKSIYIFNPFFNKIERILLDTKEEEFPICFALYNRLPYCFCSGGKVKIDDEFSQLNEFFTLKRTGLKTFEKIILPGMLENKSNHCLFEIPYLKSICALGGENSNEVEVFNLEEKTWDNLPELNSIREGASCCVVNDIFIYCFFGYNTETGEYLTSIEKLDLEQNKDWELLNPYGNKASMKKKFCGNIHYRQNFEEKIFIVGGRNVFNNESQDWMSYNVINNTIEKMDTNLPYKSSFNCNSFIKLPTGLYCNITVDFQLLQFESLGNYIFGIRKK
jgi:hypothetical protein